MYVLISLTIYDITLHMYDTDIIHTLHPMYVCMYDTISHIT